MAKWDHEIGGSVMGKLTFEEFKTMWENSKSPEELYELAYKNTVHVGNTIQGFVAYTNSDLTEGRGSSIPRFVCRSCSTAERLGQKIGVQGSDGDIKERQLFAVNGEWYGPIVLQEPTSEDSKKDVRYKAFKVTMKKLRHLVLLMMILLH